MIEKLAEGGKNAFGFKVTGTLTADEIRAFEPQFELFARRKHKHPIGVLADLSAMQRSEWSARWEELQFLSKHSSHIGRVAVVGAHSWEEVMAEILSGTVLVQAETRYYLATEILHAWHWVKTARHAEEIQVRRIFPSEGIMNNYVPEYMDV